MRGRNPQPDGAARPDTRLSAGVQVTGARISVRGGLHVEGTVEGEVRVEGPLLVAAGAQVLGRVHAHRVTVRGHLDGDIEVRDVLEVEPSGWVGGSARCGRLIVQEGARCTAHFRKTGTGEESAREARDRAGRAYGQALQAATGATGRSAEASPAYEAWLGRALPPVRLGGDDGQVVRDPEGVGHLAWSKEVRDHLVFQKARRNLHLELEDHVMRPAGPEPRIQPQSAALPDPPRVATETAPTEKLAPEDRRVRSTDEQMDSDQMQLFLSQFGGLPDAADPDERDDAPGPA